MFHDAHFLVFRMEGESGWGNGPGFRVSRQPRDSLHVALLYIEANYGSF